MIYICKTLSLSLAVILQLNIFKHTSMHRIKKRKKTEKENIYYKCCFAISDNVVRH